MSDIIEGGAGHDRRQNRELREIFVEAYDVIEPFFDPANSWSGHPHEHLAAHALHEHFPELSQEQVFAIVTAAKKVFAAGRKPSG